MFPSVKLCKGTGRLESMGRCYGAFGGFGESLDVSWAGSVISTCCFCIFPEPHSQSLAQTPAFQRGTSGSERLGFVPAVLFCGPGALFKHNKVKSCSCSSPRCCCSANTPAVQFFFFKSYPVESLSGPELAGVL